MDLSGSGLIIFYLLFGFIALVLIIASVTMFILWRRRKMIITNFLAKNGQWEKVLWMPDKIGKNFNYDGQPYEFDIEECTRDGVNRPVAHYYKGNPKQQQFNYQHGEKQLNIGTKEITGKDFHTLMLSKVLRDIFQDEEVMNMLIIIMIMIAVGAVINIIVTFTHNPSCILHADNDTVNTIVKGVQTAMLRTR